MKIEQWNQIAQNIGSILGIIVGITLVIGLCVLTAWMICSLIKSDQAQKEYIKTLNEHDKAVINEYKSIFVYAWKRKKQK